jgi:flavin-binding protein dodecin
MAIAKVIEISSESNKSFDDAALNAIKEVAKTVKDVKHVWIKDMEIFVQDDNSYLYRTNCKVTFLVRNAGDMS